MEPAGFMGILKLTMQIIHKNFKHFLCIAILWALPCYAFHLDLYALDLSSLALDTLVYSLYRLIVSKERFPSPGATDDPLLISSLMLFIAIVFFSITILLISYPLLTISVCRACLNKSVSLKSSLLGVPRSAKNLALTCLCLGVVVFGFVAMTVGMIGITAGVVGVAVGRNEPATFVIVMDYVLFPLGMGGLYLAISFSLAHTVAILEEKTARGWEAMRRSMELLNGRKWVALGLVCVVYGVLQACEFSKLWRWRGATTVRMSLQAVIALFGVAAHVVLYVSCKIHKEEPLNTLMAASARFGPQESQSMDVETAAFLPN